MAQAQHAGEPHQTDNNTTLAIQKIEPVIESPLNQNQAEGLLVDFQEAEDIGKRKKEQQDAHGYWQWPGGYLFVVADGVSMGQAGALASKTAVEVMLKTFQQTIEAGEADFSAALDKAFKAANNEVFELSRTRLGMATTCVAALVTGQTLITMHAGDSRAYLSRNGLELMPVTIDHSWQTEMGELLVQQGLMTRSDMAKDQRRHTITRAFGLQLDLNGDVNAAQLQKGDLILLCSDGLWDLLPEGRLETLTKENSQDLPTFSRQLVDEAMAAGGRDNITVTLIRTVRVGKPVELPALDGMLERTATEVAERTRPIQVTSPNRKPDEPFENPVITPSERALAAARTYHPIGVVGDAPEEASLIDDVPTAKPPPPNLEMLLSKAQQNFALGDWNEAIDGFIELELLQASFTGLFESFSNSLVRYIGVAIGESQIDYVEQLILKLEKNSITRYHELMADYCNDESRRASTTQYYAVARSYAQFCLRLRPNDVRARTQIELCDLYMALQRPGASLNERLSLGQRIYARDENFGNIQDDLAQIYMEMGDEATHQRKLEDAASWYGLVLPLRPTDKRILSLASSKQRSAEDDLARQRTRTGSSFNKPNFEPTPATPTATNAVTTELPKPASLRNNTDSRTEQDQVNRLKERVSRAQKAWDGGRKEVGGEYIYLVNELNELATPNLWQPTFPRVCYDYGKWLLDQKQYDEARPYFQKAQQLGMAAAQQRLNEIDRIIRDRGPAIRRTDPIDLPDSLGPDQKAAPQSSFEPLSEPPRTLNRASLFTPRRSSATSLNPIVPPKPEPPENSRFVGASHAGDGFLKPGATPPPANNDANGLPPRSAAAVAAGNWGRSEPGDAPSQIPQIPAVPSEKATVQASVRGNSPSFEGDPVKGAVKREVGRMAGVGLPQSLDPRRAASRRWNAFGSQLKTIIQAVVIISIVIVALVLIVSIVMNHKSNPATDPTSIAGASLSPSPAVTTSVAPSGSQGVVRIEGTSLDGLDVFLAEAGNPTSPYRQLDQNTGFFQLSEATLNKLDPQQHYLIVIRPKSTATRSYATNLQPTDPAQQPFVSPEFAFDPVQGFDMTLRIMPEALAFYPLSGNATDSDSPANGHYSGATHHSIQGDFLKFYNDNGGLGRFGYPISEEFDWTGQGHVQFFERGWLTVASNGQPVTIGSVGKTVMESSCTNVLRLPANVTPLAVPTIKTDPDFDKTVTTLKLGTPQSQMFELGSDPKKKIQYFDQGRLELDETDKKAVPMLGLLGSEYAYCQGWLK